MKKKVRTLMIGSYMLVFLVFMLIYVVVQHETEKRMRNFYIEKQIAVMNQAVMRVDGELDAVKKFCLKLSQDPYVQMFSFAGPQLDRYDMEDVVKLVRNIGQNYTGDPAVEDAFIYYEKFDRIATGNSFYKAGDYYRQEWSCEGLGEEQWKELLKSKSQSGYLPDLVMRNGVKQGTYITYVHRFGSRREGETSVLAVMLKKTWLDEILDEISQGGITIIRPDEQETVRYSFGSLEGAEELSAAGLWNEGEKDWKTVKLNGTSYLATRIRSEETRWLYESLIPYKIITRQMKQSTRPLLAGLIAYGIVGVPICLFLAFKSYEPIRKIAGHVRELGGGDGQGSEVDYIYSGIANIHRRYQELEGKYGSALEEYDAVSIKLRKNRERIQEGILRQLIGGHWRDDRELEERLAGMEIDFPYDRFCVAVAQIEKFEIQGQDLNAQERALTLFMLKNISRELLEPVGKVYPVSDGPDKVCLLLNLSEKGHEGENVSESLTELMEQLKEYMMKVMEIHISIGIGTVCGRVDQLNQSSRMARRSLDYGFMLGSSLVIVYDDRKPEGGLGYRFDTKLEKHIMSALAQKDGAACGAYLDQVYGDALEQKATVNEGRQLHIYLTDLAMKVIARGCPAKSEEERYQDMVGQILNSETLPEAIALMKKLLESLCREPGKEDAANALGDHAVRFIRDHYWDTSFSLQMCAEELQVSPEHLSRTIKAETGKNFMEIVNQLRLEKAKYYLAHTDKKMEEIAELSGYGTAKSFFRSFKQSEGVTPGLWRKNIRNETSDEKTEKKERGKI